jgi:hypothetical protein
MEPLFVVIAVVMPLAGIVSLVAQYVAGERRHDSYSAPPDWTR